MAFQRKTYIFILFLFTAVPSQLFSEPIAKRDFMSLLFTAFSMDASSPTASSGPTIDRSQHSIEIVRAGFCIFGDYNSPVIIETVNAYLELTQVISGQDVGVITFTPDIEDCSPETRTFIRFYEILPNPDQVSQDKAAIAEIANDPILPYLSFPPMASPGGVTQIELEAQIINYAHVANLANFSVLEGQGTKKTVQRQIILEELVHATTFLRDRLVEKGKYPRMKLFSIIQEPVPRQIEIDFSTRSVRFAAPYFEEAAAGLCEFDVFAFHTLAFVAKNNIRPENLFRAVDENYEALLLQAQKTRILGRFSGLFDDC